MNALITGGAGFIGSHLAEALIARGGRVLAIDDLSTGSVRNVEHLRADPDRFQLVVDNVKSSPLLPDLVERADVIYHLAAAVGVRLVVEQSIATIETNLDGTEAVLSLASAKRKPVFIASTSEVYGKSIKERFSEGDDLVLGPPSIGRWAYACSKAMNECLALAYQRDRGVPVVVGRLFNTVGPRQTGRYGMVLPNFVRQALRGEPITVFGDGHQTRAFGYVGDVVNAIIRLMELPASVGEIFNVGNDQEISIDDLAARVKQLAESASPIVHVPYDQAYGPAFEDIRRRVPDLRKLRAAVGYAPATSLDEIIMAVVRHERAQPQG